MSGSNLRVPGLLVLVNGAALGGVLEARVVSGSHFAADRFSLRVALSAVDAAWWADAADVLVEVRFGLDGAWLSAILGEADSVEIDPVGRILCVEGRDLSARLIEARTQESFQNRTASEIAEVLAARHGLGAAVTPTSVPVGRYYQIEHDRITLDQFSAATTEWELLVSLARLEGFDVWVEGQTLHFEAPGAGAAAPVPVGVGDVLGMRLERSLTLARDIEVTVKSWNSRQRSAFTQTARRGGVRSGGGAAGGRVLRTVLVRPNLTPAQALQLAQKTLADLTRHEFVASVTMPGELSLMPRMQVAVSGSGTAFDQVYEVAEVERSLSVRQGFVQRVRARTLPAVSAATVPADAAAP